MVMEQISGRMKRVVPSKGPDVDWRECAAFLDFDGTLAPLENHPDKVALPDRERRLLLELSDRCNGAIAILTGRELENIRQYFKGILVVLSGSHGAEIDILGDPKVVPGADVEMDRCYAAAKAMADEHGLLIEKKAAAIALHYRGRMEMRAQVIGLIDRLAETCQEMTPLHGNMVSELTLRDYSKGTALIQLINHPAFAGRRPVAIGDDTTDENAFRAAKSIGGLGLRIGSAETEANHVFDTRSDFVDWLEQTLETK